MTASLRLRIPTALVASLLALTATFALPLPVGAGPAASLAVGRGGGVATEPGIPAGMTEVAPAFSPGSDAVALGPLTGNLSLEVAVGISSANPSGLAAYAAALGTGVPFAQAPLPAKVADERFGASPAAVQAATAYFRADGLEATANADGLLLDVQGPSTAIANAFATTFELYEGQNGSTFFDHPTPAILPAIAPWSGVLGLANLTAATPSLAPAPAGSIEPAAACAGFHGGFTPCSIWSAYNFSSLVFNGNSSINGTGTTVAVVDAYSGGETENQLKRDLATFTSMAGIGVGTVNYLYPIPTTEVLNSSRTNPGWGLEEALDLEWARAAAPGATIDMTFSPNNASGLYEAVDWLVANDRVNVISLSWGEPDTGVYNAFANACSAGCNASTDGSYAVLAPVLQFAAVEGITVLAASGDCGSADGTSGVATNYPASDPYVTGVGGTNLTLGTGGVYGSEVAWSGNESGAHAPGCRNGGGSGGGYAPFPRPWWQVGLPTSPSTRGVPDVAMVAGTPVVVIEGGGNVSVEGTSIGSPIWAGIVALADQRAGHPLGFLDPSLYQLATGSNHALYFHDITSGSNGYHAGAGWDPVTGEGSPIVANLVPALAAPPALSSGNLTATLGASPRFGTAPLTVTFTFRVAGGTGPYRLEGVSFGDSNATLSTNGSARYVYASPGTYVAEAFAVDASGNVTVSDPVLIVVGGGWPLAVNLTATPSSASVGATVDLNATVHGGTPPYAYTFYFGDGSYALNASAPTTTHAYAAAGSYCASVLVTDAATPGDAGASDPVAVTVGGGSPPPCAGSVPLGLDGGPATSRGLAPLSDVFTVEAYGGSGPPYAYLWTLPNGTTETTENVTVAFPSAGTYVVSLQAAGPSGPSVLENWTIVVERGPFLPPYVLLLLAAGIGGAIAVVAIEFERSRRRPSP